MQGERIGIEGTQLARETQRKVGGGCGERGNNCLWFGAWRGPKGQGSYKKGRNHERGALTANAPGKISKSERKI